MKELFLATSSSLSRFTSAVACVSLMLANGRDSSEWRKSFINSSPSYKTIKSEEVGYICVHFI